MKVPFPYEIDWFWLATDIVMPLLTWFAVITSIAIILTALVRAMRRHEERVIAREAEEVMARWRASRSQIEEPQATPSAQQGSEDA